LFEERKFLFETMGKTVTFNDDIAIVNIAFEDRKRVWMTLAADRFRFQRRIKQLSQILDPILRRHVKLQAKGVIFLKGNLVEKKNVDAIVHQCNCLTVKSHGLSKQIARKFPWADVEKICTTKKLSHTRRPRRSRIHKGDEI
jgi:hypothetical protein